MSRNRTTRVFCARKSRQHQIGVVYAANDGWVVEYKAATWHGDAIFPSDDVYQLSADEATRLPGHCAACKRSAVLDSRVLLTAAIAGWRCVYATCDTSDDGYPPVSQRLKTDPRCE